MSIIDEEVWSPMKVRKNNTKYEISSYGNIRNSNTGNILSQTKNKSGYVYVHLYTNHKEYTLAVHRLMAENFMPNNDGIRIFINHIDGNKMNNSITNLEWVTRSENMQHAYDNGLKPKMIGKDHPKAKFDDDLIHVICQLMENGCTNAEIRSSLKLENSLTTQRMMTSLRNGRNWKHITCHYDIPKNPVIYKHTDEFIKSICVLFESGKNASEIREILNLPTDTEYISLLTRIKMRKAYQHISKDYIW